MKQQNRKVQFIKGNEYGFKSGRAKMPLPVRPSFYQGWWSTSESCCGKE
jgi:hypothetical protein